MSAEYTNGGPAFPCVGIVRRDEAGNQYGAPIAGPGMSLRDWIAGQALAGLLGNAGITFHIGEGEGPSHDQMAKAAYMVSDAMLAARERGQ